MTKVYTHPMPQARRLATPAPLLLRHPYSPFLASPLAVGEAKLRKELYNSGNRRAYRLSARDMEDLWKSDQLPRRASSSITHSRVPRACYERGRKSHRNADSTVGLIPPRSTFPTFLSRF